MSGWMYGDMTVRTDWDWWYKQVAYFVPFLLD